MNTTNSSSFSNTNSFDHSNSFSIPNNVKKSKKKGGAAPLKLSTDPQSVAARRRRHRISERIKILQTLVPGGSKMDTVSMLEEAIQYVKFLQNQIWIHQAMIHEDQNNINVPYSSKFQVNPFCQDQEFVSCNGYSVTQMGLQESWFHQDEENAVGFNSFDASMKF